MIPCWLYVCHYKTGDLGIEFHYKWEKGFYRPLKPGEELTYEKVNLSFGIDNRLLEVFDEKGEAHDAYPRRVVKIAFTEAEVLTQCLQ